VSDDSPPGRTVATWPRCVIIAMSTSSTRRGRSLAYAQALALVAIGARMRDLETLESINAVLGGPRPYQAEQACQSRRRTGRVSRP
jgi:hypothetical protein